MKRGTILFSTDELKKLTQSINWALLPGALSDRLQSAEIPENRDDISVFLSEDDAEYILDAVTYDTVISTEAGKRGYEKLKAFLVTLRKNT